ncbi:MAG: 3-Oxoadipate enol-lactonase, alpha/beta hydrolase fold family [Candidatus Carbobacillus altaicus]|uniref:3-Oxoadipate enol-lactonase, alpha/beta hydrolase fold family n=1 Tax=Candidatus Carbonibacillus altaicus TaxID=2163959 RepID=A0A2R6Y208_9BACL|nr:MAG: 3-Oxoadipate enol-lactonase, alpha/beta hydrolase fold family [Candidatus Carbobacillus altaicus]
MKTVQIANGETLGYREREGGESVLLLIHGNMNSSKHWDLVLENADPRFKIYAVDLRGFGISTYNNRIDSLRDFSEDVKLFVDEIGLKRFSLMGWSTGGGVAMQFAADYPERVEKLVLMASMSTRGYPFYVEDEQGRPDLLRRVKTKSEMERHGKTLAVNSAYERKDKEFLTALYNAVIYDRHRPDPARYAEYLDDMLTQRNLADVYHALNTFNISAADHEAGAGSNAAANIQAPTLVLWGEYDRVVPKQMALDIVEDIGDNAELIVLKGCGHSPLVDDLDQLLRRVTDFLL